MEILSFKLIKEGLGGISINANEYLKGNNGRAIIDKVKGRERKIPLSRDMVNKIQKLRYAYLNLTGHWLDAYNQFIDDEYEPLELSDKAPQPHQYMYSLWHRTFIEAVILNGESFKISGRVRITDAKSINITTPEISADDDFSFYSMTANLIDSIFGDITIYFNDGITSLEEAKQYMLNLFADNDKAREEIEVKSEEELQEMYQTELEKKGAIVIMPPQGIDQISMNQVDVKESKNEIKSAKVDESEEVDDEYEKEDTDEEREDGENDAADTGTGPGNDDVEIPGQEYHQEHLDDASDIPGMNDAPVDDDDIVDVPAGMDMENEIDPELAKYQYSENMPAGAETPLE